MDHQFETIFRQKLISTFRFTASFLNQYNLTWWACYGTAIGAVRHQNLIPWDDDIDICMPREDFDKLSALQSKFEDTEYKLMLMGDDDLFTVESKIVLKDSSWQEKEYHYCNTGIYIDIFPLDSINVSYNSIVKMQANNLRINRKFFFALVRPSFHSFINAIKSGNYTTLLVLILGCIFPYSKKEKYLKEYNELIQSYRDAPDGDYYVSFGGADREKEIFKKEWFSSTIEMKFADFMIKMPAGYDAMLTSIYGDYMKLPPKEKQVSNHEQYYINLSRRLAHSEILTRVKNGYNHEII